MLVMDMPQRAVPEMGREVLVFAISETPAAARELFYIPRTAGDFQKQVSEATDYVNHRYAALKGDVYLSRLPADPDAVSIPSWEQQKTRLNENYLAELAGAGVSREVLRLIEDNLDVQKNRQELLQEVEHAYGRTERERTVQVLQVIADAHRGQVAARPQDQEGLFHVPYMNHSICMALNGVRAGLSASAVRAILLHDVIEDTPYDAARLRRIGIEPEVIDMVLALSRKPGETRDMFLQRVSGLEGEARAAKCLDRLDNLIRAFGIPDRGYAERVIGEDNSVYKKLFSEAGEVRRFEPVFQVLHEELAKKWGIAA